MKRVVITGATSSIGIALIEECIEKGIEVLAIANKGSKNLGRIPKNTLVSVFEASLNEYSSIFQGENALGKYDIMFHLAWAATQGDGARALLQPQAMNIMYSLDAVDLAERLGCAVFVGSGSQAEYGRTNEVLTEETECHPETPYGMAKLCAGQMTRLACKEKGIKHIWPRILSAYGPNCQPQTIINYTIFELLQCREPELTKCEQIWDFIYTTDVAKALILLSDKGRDGNIYIIGSGNSAPLKDYILQIKKVMKSTCSIGFGKRDYTNNTVMHLACDISKLRKDTGYEATISFEEGIKRTIEWVKYESGYIKENN